MQSTEANVADDKAQKHGSAQGTDRCYTLKDVVVFSAVQAIVL